MPQRFVCVCVCMCVCVCLCVCVEALSSVPFYFRFIRAVCLWVWWAYCCLLCSDRIQWLAGLWELTTLANKQNTKAVQPHFLLQEWLFLLPTPNLSPWSVLHICCYCNILINTPEVRLLVEGKCNMFYSVWFPPFPQHISRYGLRILRFMSAEGKGSFRYHIHCS
jgi:hypothetical protein